MPRIPNFLLHHAAIQQPLQVPVNRIVRDHHSIAVEGGTHGRSRRQMRAHLAAIYGYSTPLHLLPCRIAQCILANSSNDSSLCPQAMGYQRSRRQSTTRNSLQALRLDFLSHSGLARKPVKDQIEKKLSQHNQPALFSTNRYRFHAVIISEPIAVPKRFGIWRLASDVRGFFARPSADQ